MNMNKNVKVVSTLLGVGIVLGVLLLAGFRFFAYEEDETHYHANFAVYIDGERVPFEDPLYYEEVTQCSVNSEPKSTERVHMHQPENDVIHVHDEAVSWGQFFENIDFAIGDDFLKTRDDLFVESASQELTYILNGKTVRNITTQVIKDEDKLLVSYGDVSETELDSQFEAVNNSAHTFNENADPGSCGGAEESTWKKRLENILF